MHFVEDEHADEDEYDCDDEDDWRNCELEKGSRCRYVGWQATPLTVSQELHGQALCPRRRFHLSDVHLSRPCGVTRGGPSLSSSSPGWRFSCLIHPFRRF